MLLKEISIEFRRGIGDRKFLACILIGVFLAIFQYIQIVLPEYKADVRETFSKNLYPVSTFEIWMGARGGVQSSIYYVIAPLLAVLPYASSLFLDIKTGYIRNILTRTSKRTYFLSKTIVSILLGGIASLFPMLLNLYMTAMTVPSLIPEVTQKIFPAINMKCMFHELFYTRPYIYVGMYLFIIFLFMCIFILLSLLLAFYANHILEVIIFPFIVYVFTDFVFEYFGIPWFSPKQIIRIDQDVEISGLITTVELIILATLIIVFYIRRVKKYEEV